MSSNDVKEVCDSAECGEKIADHGGPHTPEGDKERKSPIESPPILEKAEDAALSDESTTAVADESQDIENNELADETLTSNAGEGEPPVGNAKEAIKRKIEDSAEEAKAKRAAPEETNDVQAVAPVSEKEKDTSTKADDDDVVLIQEDDAKFKAPELPKDKGSKSKKTVDCDWDGY